MTRNLRWLAPGTGLIAVHQLCEASVPVLTGSVSAIATWIAALAVLFGILTVVYRFGARLLMLAIARESHSLRVEMSHNILDPLGIRTDFKPGSCCPSRRQMPTRRPTCSTMCPASPGR